MLKIFRKIRVQKMNEAEGAIFEDVQSAKSDDVLQDAPV